MDGALQMRRVAQPAPPVPAAGKAGEPLVLVVGVARDPQRLNALFIDNGFAIRDVPDAQAAEAVLATQPVELIVLEGRLGDGGPLAVCSRLSRVSAAPVMVLSGADSPTERIIALEVGADDVMSEPVELRELVARARALVRRSRRLNRPAPEPARPWTLDGEARRFSGPGGRWVNLTPSEMAVLELFLTHPGRPISAETAAGMLEPGHVWTVESFRTLIVRLRRRLVESGLRGAAIRTVYGSGYVFEPPQATDGGAR